MDEESFLQLLSAFSNVKEMNEEAHANLISYRDQNTIEFLNSCLSIILGNFDPNLKTMASTLIYGSVVHFPISQNIIDLTDFSNSLLASLPCLFPAYPLNGVFTNMIIYTISKLILIRFQTTRNTDIQSMILQYFKTTTSLEPYIFAILADTILSDINMCGFPLETLILMVTGDLHYSESIIIRFQLYFAIATHSTESEELHSLFIPLFESIQEENLPAALHILDSFTEKSSSFLVPHIEYLIPFLTAKVSQGEEICRHYAMNCLATFAEGAPILCQNTPFYYETVMLALINVMTEVPDTNPDTDNEQLYGIQIYQTAQEAFSRICVASGSTKYFIYFEKLRMIEFQDPNIPWQHVYAIVSCISLFDSFIKETPIVQEDQSTINAYVQMLFGFIRDFSVHQRIRIASYSAICTIATYCINYFQVATGSYFFNEIKYAILNDPYPLGQKYALKCLTKYFGKRVIPKIIISFFPDAFLEIQAMLPNIPECFAKYVVRALSVFPILSEFADYAFDFVQTLYNLYYQTNDLNLKVEIIHAFEATCATSGARNDFIEVSLKFLLESLQIYFNNELTPKEIVPSILCLIKFLKADILPLTNNFIPQILEIAKKELKVDEIKAFENYNITHNLYIKIPTQVYGTKYFVEKNEVREIVFAIKILNYCARAIQNDFHDYVPFCIEIIKKWCLYQYYIEKIKKNAWYFLQTLLDIFYLSNGTKLIDLSIFLVKKTNLIEGTPLYILNVMEVLYNVFAKIKLINYDNQNYISSLFSFLSAVIDHLLTLKAKTLKTISQYNDKTNEGDDIDLDEGDGKDLTHIDDALNTIEILFQNLFILYPQLTIPWFVTNMYQKCFEYLQMPECYLVGVSLLTQFTLATNSSDLVYLLVGLFIGIIRKCTEQVEFKLFYTVATDTFKYLGLILSSFDLTPEFVKDINIFFYEFVGNEKLSYTEDISYIHDYGLIAYTKFLIRHDKVIEDYDKAICQYLNCFPIWEPVEDIKVAFQYLATLIENQTPCIFNDTVRFEKVIELIITGLYIHPLPKRTARRLITIIQTLMQNPNYSNFVNNVYESLGDQRKEKFEEVLCNGEQLNNDFQYDDEEEENNT